jgi:predicted aldo/keto reductase-like oxidoreductase
LDKVRLGRTNLMVSRLGFGGIPIQRVSEGDAVAVVRKCLELGITFIDTANAYTSSEQRIGKAIRGRQEGLIIATKTMERDPDAVARHLELSCERLGVRAIDLYQFHNVGDAKAMEAVLRPGGALSVAEEAKRRGIIRHIGVTCHALDAAKALVRTDRFETIMFPFNFIKREPVDELLPLTRQYDVGFIAMKPLEGGRLDNVRLAFKYLWQFPDVATVVGIERVAEIVEIMDILNNGPLTLTVDDYREIERLRVELAKAFCRRCDYCQPCTQGIPISLALDYPSIFRRLPMVSIFTGFIAEAMEKAATCTECGECEERCPYRLPIREMLSEYVGMYRQEKARRKMRAGA